MSLPININLPLRTDFARDENKEEYMRDLIYELNSMYDSIANNVNGFIRNNAETDSSKWTPTLASTTGSTFTYSSQIGWSLRQGLYTNLWFDITWTAVSAASGNLFVELPYKVTPSGQMPWVGVIQDSSITYTGGYSKLVINAIPDTYRGEIWQTGSASATVNLTTPSSGRLIAHIFYIGLEDE